MFTPEDTIVAIATPPGRGGLGVVRLSGPDAREVAQALLRRDEPLAPRHATLVTVEAAGAAPIDHAVVTWFPAPHSYTGDEVVEISAHGSPVVLREIVAAAVARGARLAEPGEFTFRAFLNGRIDLVQAEAVADLIDSVTPLQARAAFDQLQGTLTGAIGAIDRELFDLAARLEASIDFPEEGFHFIDRDETRRALDGVRDSMERLLASADRGKVIREGLHAVIAGKPNVGKSTLFNRLVGSDRTIVSRQPGTTRDAIVEDATVAGLSVTLVDTAGIRETDEEIEAEGVRRSHHALQVADLAMVVLDLSRPFDADDEAVLAATEPRRRVIVANKTDLPAAWDVSRLAGETILAVSLAQDPDIEGVRGAIAAHAARETWSGETPAVTNVRHIALLARARDAIARATATLANDDSASEEVILFEIGDARAALEEVSGRRTPDDTLRHIFERFCIGK